MPDLSAYISIAVVLDNSGVSPVIRIIDNSAYPVGVDQQIAGILSITEPDMVTDENSDFGNPNIYWSAGALVQASRPLRLANNNRFQNGGYSIKYSVRCPGYSDTVLLKTFVLDYTAAVPVMTPAFDNFTPSLKVVDATSYGVAGLNFISANQQWTGLIRSVLGTNRAINGTGITFDLVYTGNYYDSAYDINLISTVTYQLPDISISVTVIDKLVVPQETFYAEIPPTLQQLLDGLTLLKSQLDAALNNQNTYLSLLTTYNYAVAIYTHLIDRGSIGSLSGLSDYVYQLQKIFNHGVQPIYVNTNGIIPPYNWGGSSGSTAWAAITGKPNTNVISWTVGQGGFPGVGALSITDARLANIPASQVLMFRGGIFYSSTVKASTATSTLSWTDGLGVQEPVFILILPL